MRLAPSDRRRPGQWGRGPQRCQVRRTRLPRSRPCGRRARRATAPRRNRSIQSRTRRRRRRARGPARAQRNTLHARRDLGHRAPRSPRRRCKAQRMRAQQQSCAACKRHAPSFWCDPQRRCNASRSTHAATRTGGSMRSAAHCRFSLPAAKRARGRRRRFRWASLRRATRAHPRFRGCANASRRRCCVDARRLLLRGTHPCGSVAGMSWPGTDAAATAAPAEQLQPRVEIVAGADGSRIHCVHAGSGPSACSRTDSCSSRLLRARLRRAGLSSGHRVIAFDQRGHGRSRAGSDGQGSAAAAAGLRRGARSLRTRRDATLVAHSMGGFLALRFCLRHPELAQRRLRQPGVARSQLPARSARRAAWRIICRSRLDQVRADLSALWRYPPTRPRDGRGALSGTSPDPALRRAHARDVPAPGYAAVDAPAAGDARENYHDRLHEIPIQARVLCGELDRTCPPSHSRRIGPGAAERRPRAGSRQGPHAGLRSAGRRGRGRVWRPTGSRLEPRSGGSPGRELVPVQEDTCVCRCRNLQRRSRR